jgi:S-formylglutathione hydrolase FrmB
MALITCQFHSEILGMATTMNVILPQQTVSQIGLANATTAGPCKVLYLLHGLSDDHSIWLRRTNIERYVAPLGIAVVMPNCHRGFYTDAVDGFRYFTHIAEEVPALAEQFFQISSRPEDRSIAGLSMGGYGAFKIALRQPERWAAAASLSGVADMDCAFMRNAEGAFRHELERLFGNLDALRPEDDLPALLRAVANTAGPKPRLFQCCGSEDFLYDANSSTRALAASLPLDYRYEEGPGGHDWDFWDRWIQRVLTWMFDPA